MQHSFALHTGSLLILSCIVGMWLGLAVVLRDQMKWYAVGLLVVGTTLGALIGGRLFHVFWERPTLLKTPALVLTRWDGMTFYGSLIIGGTFAWLLSLRLVPQSNRGFFYDTAAIGVAFCIGILRIGCFASGCCWGKMSSVSWAVTYFDSHSAMPFLGIPVHPVQLYESALAFLIAGVLIWSRFWFPDVLQGKLLGIFLLLYAVARFFVEFYRGDRFRGESVLWGLSTSQVISVFIFSITIAWLLARMMMSPDNSLKKSWFLENEAR